jgi:hypothetical protein
VAFSRAEHVDGCSCDGERQRSRRVLRQSRRVVASSDGLRDASRRESSCSDAVQPTCDPLRASSDVIRLTGRGAHARSHAVRRPIRRRLARFGDILLRSRGESVASCRRRATHAGFGAVAATSVKPHQRCAPRQVPQPGACDHLRRTASSPNGELTSCSNRLASDAGTLTCEKRRLTREVLDR